MVDDHRVPIHSGLIGEDDLGIPQNQCFARNFLASPCFELTVSRARRSSSSVGRGSFSQGATREALSDNVNVRPVMDP